MTDDGGLLRSLKSWSCRHLSRLLSSFLSLHTPLVVSFHSPPEAPAPPGKDRRERTKGPDRETRLPAAVRNRREQEANGNRGERGENWCSGSYCQAVGFLVIKDDSISERRG